MLRGYTLLGRARDHWLRLSLALDCSHKMLLLKVKSTTGTTTTHASFFLHDIPYFCSTSGNSYSFKMYLARQTCASWCRKMHVICPLVPPLETGSVAMRRGPDVVPPSVPPWTHHEVTTEPPWSHSAPYYSHATMESLCSFQESPCTYHRVNMNSPWSLLGPTGPTME